MRVTRYLKECVHRYRELQAARSRAQVWGEQRSQERVNRQRTHRHDEELRSLLKK